MAKFRITGPDGANYVVDVENEADLPAAAQSIFGAQSAAAPAAPPVPIVTPQQAAAAEGRNLPTPGDVAAPAPEQPGFLDRAGRQLMLGTQAVGRGAAKAVGALPDIANLGANVVLSGADKVAEQFGGNVDFRFKNFSDALIDESTKLATGAGVPLQTPETTGEKLAGNIVDFGTQGLLGGVGLARAAAARAPQLAQPGAAPRMLDPLIRPYLDDAGKAIAGDTIAGAGAGTALTGTQALPTEIRDVGGGLGGALADLGAMLLGGTGAGMLAEGALNGPRAIVDKIRGGMTAKDVPLDPETGMPVSNSVADMAARYVQGQAIDPAGAAETVTRTAREFSDQGLPVPTTGLISGDTGLEALERGQRTQHSTGSVVKSPDADAATKSRYSFGERDTALRDSAVENVNALRPEGARPEAFPERAQELSGARVEAAQRGVDAARGRQAGVERAMREPAADLQAFEGQGGAASRNIDETVRTTRDAELARNRELYSNPALIRAEVPDEPLRAVAQDLRALDTERAPLDPVVRKYVDRFDVETPRVEEQTVASPILGEDGRPVTRTEEVTRGEPPPPMTMREVNANIAEVDADIQANLSNGAVVSQLRRVKNVLSGYADELATSGQGEAADAARAARQNYAERVAPNFRQGAGGRFDEAIKSDRTGYSTRPTDTADTFLTRPEDARDLMRISRLGGNEAATAGDARTWLFDQLARRGVAKDGAIDADKLTRWRNVNRDLLREVPGLDTEVNDMVRAARRGESLSERFGADLTSAEARLRSVESETQRGPIGQAAGKSPENAVASVFGAGNPQQAMRELKGTVGRNPEALAGMKAAVADHFASRVSGVNPANVSEGTQNINFSQLVKQFNKNEATLAELYTPEEMNTLRRAQRVLEPLSKRQGQATTGSITAENLANSSAFPAVETLLRLKFGMLKGGGITSVLRRTLTALGGDAEQQANRLVTRMMFDPDLAAHLLTRDASKVQSPAWNAKLQTLLRRGEAARGLNDSMQEDDDGN